MKKLLFSITIFMVIGCFSNCANSNSSNSNSANSNSSNTLSNSSPSPTATPEIIDTDAETALSSFLANNYKGWKKIGLSDTVESCSETESCILHLQKDGKDKIITIIFRKLIKENGHQYWVVSEATPYEVAKTRIDVIREDWANQMVEDREMFTDKQWKSVLEMAREDILEEEREMQEMADDYKFGDQ